MSMNCISKTVRWFAILPLVAISVFGYANDGAFRVNGNQLIPMYETDISVKKEVLSIRRINSKQAEVDVYYEFFNPAKTKELEVGFEAFSPSGDVDARPVHGGQPYITRFTVSMNGEAVPWKVAIVRDSLYYVQGKFKTIPAAEAMKEGEDNDFAGFFYVYHFRVPFKPGINIIRHTYTVDLSSSVAENYSFEYILTAANRWANRQIDDFTLKIDMGDFQDLSMEKTFFKSPSGWSITGTGKQVERKTKYPDYEKDMLEFFVQQGSILFQQKNFHPSGELQMHAFNSSDFSGNASKGHDGFDWKTDRLPFSIDDQDLISSPSNEPSKKVLKNLPFARRGYVFISPELKTYYLQQLWYLPDPNYIPDVKQLTQSEQDWLRKLQNQNH
jgi:hypothetical protein